MSSVSVKGQLYEYILLHLKLILVHSICHLYDKKDSEYDSELQVTARISPTASAMFFSRVIVCPIFFEKWNNFSVHNHIIAFIFLHKFLLEVLEVIVDVQFFHESCWFWWNIFLASALAYLNAMKLSLEGYL